METVDVLFTLFFMYFIIMLTSGNKFIKMLFRMQKMFRNKINSKQFLFPDIAANFKELDNGKR